MYTSVLQRRFPGFLPSFCLLSQPALQKQDSGAKGPRGAVRVGMAQGWRRSRQWEWVDCVYFSPLSPAGWEMTVSGRGIEERLSGVFEKTSRHQSHFTYGPPSSPCQLSAKPFVGLSKFVQFQDLTTGWLENHHRLGLQSVVDPGDKFSTGCKISVGQQNNVSLSKKKLGRVFFEKPGNQSILVLPTMKTPFGPNQLFQDFFHNFSLQSAL